MVKLPKQNRIFKHILKLILRELLTHANSVTKLSGQLSLEECTFTEIIIFNNITFL